MNEPHQYDESDVDAALQRQADAEVAAVTQSAEAGAEAGRQLTAVETLALPYETEGSFAMKMAARVCHEANRAICVAFGDNSQLPWADAADWQRSSAVAGVAFALDNPDAPPSAQHEAWCADKVAAGWVYGPAKDEVAKTHHCLVPYDQLPPNQRAKDHVFKAIVNTLFSEV